MNIYISGRITGRDPEDYKAQFGRGVEIVKNTGNVAINPAEWDREMIWDERMERAKGLIQPGVVDMVYMLKGWSKSREASRERFWAMCYGIPILYQDDEDKNRFREL